MLEVPAVTLTELVAHCLASLPHEGCGLLIGHDDVVTGAVPTRNAARSALRYEVDPDEHLAADRAAGEVGLDVIGAFHSHTHTDAWPSVTDVASAIDPSWHWVVVSLRSPDAVVRSFRIDGGEVHEEPLVVLENHEE